MITFKCAMMVPYPFHLDYEQIHNIFAVYADWADRATEGDRSAWGLHWTGNTVTIAFMRKRDRNKFAEIFRAYIAKGSPRVGSANSRDEERLALTGKWPRRDFMSSYMLEFDRLDPEQVGHLGAKMSDLADHVTGDDRTAYEVWFHADKVHVGFEHEEDRDEFADIIDEEAADEEIKFTDAPAPADASLHRITVH